MVITKKNEKKRSREQLEAPSLSTNQLSFFNYAHDCFSMMWHLANLLLLFFQVQYQCCLFRHSIVNFIHIFLFAVLCVHQPVRISANDSANKLKCYNRASKAFNREVSSTSNQNQNVITIVIAMPTSAFCVVSSISRARSTWSFGPEIVITHTSGPSGGTSTRVSVSSRT